MNSCLFIYYLDKTRMHLGHRHSYHSLNSHHHTFRPFARHTHEHAFLSGERPAHHAHSITARQIHRLGRQPLKLFLVCAAHGDELLHLTFGHDNRLAAQTGVTDDEMKVGQIFLQRSYPVFCRPYKQQISYHGDKLRGCAPRPSATDIMHGYERPQTFIGKSRLSHEITSIRGTHGKPLLVFCYFGHLIKLNLNDKTRLWGIENLIIYWFSITYNIKNINKRLSADLSRPAFTVTVSYPLAKLRILFEK